MVRAVLAASAAAVAVVFLLATDTSFANDVTILTDADAGVRVICRNDQTLENCLIPRGGVRDDMDDWDNHARYVRVHNDNNSDVGYWHFDLSEVSPESQVAEARFQLDTQSNSWGDTTVAVVAIADPNSDWDLNEMPEAEIIGETAPQADWELFAWTGDPDNDGQQRFNEPLPFLDEGFDAGDIVRILDETILIENQDPFTDGIEGVDPGNSYGGFGCCDGPGTGGSADQGNNIWPVKNAVDVDITDLVQWKLGQNPDYSSFPPTDRELTIMVRTDFPEAGGNGFARFIAKESEFIGGEFDLQPGRIVLSGTIIEGPGEPVLWAGDADQDLDFDQLDLVQVQVAAKYLTGQPATWGEGDWNGAPGGSQGDPPAGNGLFDTLDVIAALSPGHYLTGPYAALEPEGQGDGNASITYNPGNGEVGVQVRATELTSINIDSAAAIFTGEPAQNLGGSFDNDADANIFKATFGSSFGSLSFGNVAQAGLSEDFVAGDLTVVGSLAGGGDLGAVDLIYIPEPSTLTLLGLGLLGAIATRRRKPY